MLSNRKDAEMMLEKLKGGGDFAELAAEWSLDVASARWKGILGVVEVGHGPSSIEDVIFELGPGEIAGPIETAKGFYVVRVDSILEMVQKPYEERRDYLMYQMRKRKHTPVIEAFMDHFWRNLCRAMDMESLADDPRFDSRAKRLEHREELDSILEEGFLK